MDKPVLLISACLFGEAVRYDASAKPLAAEARAALDAHFRLVPICPECMGGLPIPRPAAELAACDGGDALDGAGQVVTHAGEDVTAAFVDGAQQVLACARKHGAETALLKANSPSCGHGRIHDGSFGGVLRDGDGVTSALLRRHGIRVISETDLATLAPARAFKPD